MSYFEEAQLWLMDEHDQLHSRLLRAEEEVYNLRAELAEMYLAVPDLEARLTRWKESEHFLDAYVAALE